MKHVVLFRPMKLLRALLALSLLFVLFLSTAAAETAAEHPEVPMTPVLHPMSEIGEYVSKVYVINQLDMELRQPMYNYRGMVFPDAGCSPASYTNAFSALFGVYERDASFRLLHDMIYVLCNGNMNNNGCNAALLYKLTKTKYFLGWPNITVCQELGPIIEKYPGEIDFVDDTPSPEEMVNSLRGKPHHLLMVRCTLAEDWTWLSRLSAALEDAGLGDARISLIQMSVGTEGTKGPFYLSEGHYVSYYMQAHELNSAGTLYMLDSMPRCITAYEEELGFSHKSYQFLANLKSDAPLSRFNTVFDVERINNNTLQLVIKDEKMAELNALQPQEAVVQLADCISTLDLYGRGVVAVMIP